MTELITLLANILLGLGTFFILTGSLGTLRFPDFFTRTHAFGVADALGLPLVLFGLLLHFPLGLISFKILLLIGFAMITSATASHALSKAALLSGLKPLEGEDARGHAHAKEKAHG